MRDSNKPVRIVLSLLSACLWSSPVFGQEQLSDKPKSAGSSSSFLSDEGLGADQGSQTLQPDTQPLSGVQNPTIGSPESRHSYVVPGIQYTGNGRSDSVAGNGGWNMTSFVSTDLSLVEQWTQSGLSLNYSGGGFFSTDNIQGNGQYQQLAANYEIDGRRWQADLTDQFSYLPQSSFGFGGPSGISTPGVAGNLAVPLPGLQANYIPGQTILTAIGPRYSNSSAVQITLKASPRGAITIAGVYGTLRFIDSGNTNSDTDTLTVGYDYSISRKDTLGLSYRFSAYRYPGDAQAFGNHAIQLEYGRKITGKMALRLSGGPELMIFRVPIRGSTQWISGSGSATMTYALGHTNLSLLYVHGSSGGSGVLTGAVTDQAVASIGKQLTRVWNGSVNFGFARNRQILGAQHSPTFDTWLAGGGLNRSLGRSVYMSVGYQAQIQNTNTVLGSTNYTAHQLFVTFEWHTRPLVLH